MFTHLPSVWFAFGVFWNRSRRLIFGARFFALRGRFVFGIIALSIGFLERVSANKRRHIFSVYVSAHFSVTQQSRFPATTQHQACDGGTPSNSRVRGTSFYRVVQLIEILATFCNQAKQQCQFLKQTGLRSLGSWAQYISMDRAYRIEDWAFSSLIKCARSNSGVTLMNWNLRSFCSCAVSDYGTLVNEAAKFESCACKNCQNCDLSDRNIRKKSDKTREDVLNNTRKVCGQI